MHVNNLSDFTVIFPGKFQLNRTKNQHENITKSVIHAYVTLTGIVIIIIITHPRLKQYDYVNPDYL